MTTSSPEICRTALSGLYNGEPFVNVVHFGRVDFADMTVADLSAIHSILDDAAADNDSWRHIINNVDADVNVNNIYSRTLDDVAPVELSSTVALPGGTSGQDAQPLLAILVKLTTGLANRTSRGRLYLTGVNTGMWATGDSDVLQAPTLSAIQTAMDEFLAAWKANATYQWVVYSRKLAGLNFVAPYREVDGAAVQPRFALQTRRSPRR
jgi:hypothetical protein